MAVPPHEARAVGSFWLWLCTRLGEAILVCATCVLLMLLGLGAPVIFGLIMLLATAIGVDSVAYGYMHDSGIFFRRYLKWHFLPWDEVAAVRWRPSWLTIYLKEAPLLRRSLSFSTQTSTWDGIRQLLGRSTPEVVSWLDQQMAQRAEFPRWRVGYDSWKDTLAFWIVLLLLFLAVLALASHRWVLFEHAGRDDLHPQRKTAGGNDGVDRDGG